MKGKVRLKSYFTKKKLIALTLVISMIIQMFSPFEVLLKRSYATVTPGAEPLVSIIASEPYTSSSGNKVIKVTYAITGENIVSIDFNIGFDKTKIAPAKMSTGAAFTTATIGTNTASCVEWGDLTEDMGYDKDTRKLDLTNGLIRIAISNPAGAAESLGDYGYDAASVDDAHGHNYYMTAFTVYFYLVDDSITELTTDMLDFKRVNAGMPSGFKYIYNNGGGDQTCVDPTVVSYDGGFATQTKEIDHISVKTPPTNTTYEHGDPVNLAGGVIEITYDDGSTEDISMTESAVKVTSGNPADVNNPQVDLEYHGKTTSVNLTVTDPVDSLAVATPMNDIEYNEGETFDFTGLTLTATKRSGATIPLTQSDVATSELVASVSSPNFTKTSGSTDVEVRGNQKIVFTYQGKTANTSVIVNDSIVGIDLISQPTKQVYKRGEALNLAGAQVQVTLQSGDTTTINLPNGIVTVGSYNPNNTTTVQNLSVRINTFTSPTNIEVEAYNYITGDVLTPPTKDVYEYGESLALSGGNFRFTWHSGTGTPINLNWNNTNVTITGYSPTTIGTQTLTATYNAKYTLPSGGTVNDTISDTFNVEVINPITSIIITPPSKTAYKHGDSLSLVGGSIEVTYKDTTKSYPTLTAAMITENDGSAVNLSPAISAYSPNNPISKILKITYTEDGETQTALYPITLENNITTIGMSQNPTKTTYNLNDTTYDLTGGEIVVTYAAGNSDTVSLNDTDISLTPLNTLTTTTGTKSVQVTYKGKNTAFNINVQNGVTGITITPPTDVTFNHGDTLTFGGGDIDVEHADGTHTHPAITAAMVEDTATNAAVNMNPAAGDYDATTHDLTKNLKITYTESGITQTATYSITLNNPVDSIVFTTNPVNSYNLNDTPTYPDGDILATRKAGDTETVDIVASMVSGLDTTVAGTGKTATVAYGGKSLTYNYDVIDNVVGITITAPSTTAYNHADSINFTGADIDVEYASGTHSHPTMTTAMITETGGAALNMSPAASAYDSNNELTKALTITYTENGVSQTAPYNITLTNNVTGIAMGTNPTDTNYVINETPYKLAGGDIIVTRAAGNNTVVSLSDSGISLTPIANITNTAGTKAVTVTYAGQTTTFNVIVSNAVDTITITPPTDVTFDHGDTLTFGGGSIKVDYLDGTDSTVAITNAMVTDDATGLAVNMNPAATAYNSTTHDLTLNLTITYTEDSKTETAQYSITLNNPVDSIAIATAPRSSYNLNDSTTGVGGTINVTRKAGDTDPTPVAITDIMVSGLDTTTAGTGKTATVTYEGKNTTYTYDVIDNVTGITITPPTTTSYNHSDAISVTGGDIEVTYAGGGTSHPTMTTAMFTEVGGGAVNMSPAYADYVNNQLSKTVVITYTENGVTQTANYTFTINNNVTGIAMVTNPTDTTYDLNATAYKLAGGEIGVTRAVGPTTTLDLSDPGISLTPLSSLTGTSGTKTVDVTYEGQTTSFSITVQDAVTGIAIAGTPKTAYEIGDPVDPTLSIVVTRPSGTSTIPVTSTMLSGFTTATEGAKTAQITHEGFTIPYNYTVTDEVLSIAMGTTPKQNYLVGETLDVTGGTIIVTKKSGATDTVNIVPTMVSGFNSSSVVTGQTLTVAYDGKTTSYQINVTNPVQSITLNPGPTTTTYKYGESLDLTDAYIDVVMENGTTDRLAVTSGMISGYNPNTLGNQTVTVTYGKNSAGVDVTDTFTVIVNDYVTGITVSGEITNYNYGDPLDLTQGFVNITMASGNPATAIALDHSDVTVTGYNANTIGTQTLDVTYGTESTTFQVEVSDYVTGTNIIIPTKNTYNYGNSLELTTGKVVETLASGATNDIALDSSMVTEADGSAVNMTPTSFGTDNTVSKTLKITYGSVTENYPIVIVNDISSITIKQQPKTDYQYGDTIDTSVGTIEVTRADGSKEEIPLSDGRVSFEGFDTSTPAENIPVKVKFTENGVTKETGYTIDVNDDITSITLVGTPKTIYKYGDNLDLSGLTLTVVRPSGTTPNVPITSNMVTGYSPTTLGNQTVTIAYGDKTATYNVTVEDYLRDIELVKPNKLTYKIGDTLDLTGASITEVMASGARTTGIAVTPGMVSTLDTTTEGTKTLTVTYVKDSETFTKNFAVVVQDGLSGIRVTNFPVDEYLYGNPLDLTGATIEVELESGDKETLPITPDMVTGYIASPAASNFVSSDEYIQTLTISYTKDEVTKTTTYPVTTKDYFDRIVVKNLQKTYKYGDDLNVNGATVAKVMASGIEFDQVQLTKDMVSGYNPKQEGNQTLTISYAGKTANETVTVVDDVVAISIKQEPNKTIYDYGTSLDLTGAKLNVVKYSGTYVIDITDNMVSGYNSSKEGTQTITVNYAGFDAEFSVRVLAKPETPAKPTTPTQTKYVTRYVPVPVTNEEPKQEETKPEEPKVEEPKKEDKKEDKKQEKPTKTLGEKEEKKEEEESGFDLRKIIALGLGIIGLILLFILLLIAFKRNVKVYVIENEKDGFVLGGLDRISKRNPKLDIDTFLDEETYPNRVKVHLDDSISEKLDGVELEITHRGQVIKHKVKYNDEPYEFILSAIPKADEIKE